MLDGGHELARARVLSLLDDAEMFEELTATALYEPKSRIMV